MKKCESEMARRGVAGGVGALVMRRVSLRGHKRQSVLIPENRRHERKMCKRVGQLVGVDVWLLPFRHGE